MPGKTIGTQLNPQPEDIWAGRIIIQKVAGKYDIRYQAEVVESEAVRTIVRQHIDKLEQELSKRL
jgi:hypothetical protein